MVKTEMSSAMSVLAHSLTILGLCALAILSFACGSGTTDMPTPTPTIESTSVPMPTPIPSSTSTPTAEPPLRPPEPLPRVRSAPPPPALFKPPSIDEQILDSDIIVVAEFLSVEAGVQTVPGESGVAPTYLPKQVLRFRAAEYLKGSGPSEFTVEVVDYTIYGRVNIDGEIYYGYLTSEKALAEAREAVAERNTEYDDRPGVLFLEGPLEAVEESISGTSVDRSFGFTLFNQITRSDFDYSVDEPRRTWLPARGSTGQQSIGGTSDGDREFVTDGTENPPPVITLASLKTRIGEIAAMLAAGASVEGYADCIYDKLTRERWYRDWVPELFFEETMTSGSAAGREFYRHINPDSFDYYIEWYLTGPDSVYFQTTLLDDDSDPSNGYAYVYSNARPLPSGEYKFYGHSQLPSQKVCNFRPIVSDKGYIPWTITVTAPAGTVYEAFFDVTVGTAGTPLPSEFSVGGKSTAVQLLQWDNGEVLLLLYPYVNLSGHALDFIALDGTTALTLEAGAATVDETLGAFTWAVAAQPWSYGDQLMLRIRTSNAAPTVSSPLGDTTIVNESGTQQVSLSGVFSDADNDSLTITASSSNDAIATVSVASGYSSLTVAARARGNATITVTADDGNGGTVSDSFTVTVSLAF